MSNTYGNLAYKPEPRQWELTAAPHVMTRMKRIFPRMRQGQTGAVLIADTPEICRDLEWVTERWPLAMDELAAARLAKQAEHHRATEVAVRSILAGEYHRPSGRREPALPAREYQQVVADLVRATGCVILIDDLGLGKTVSASLIFCEPDALPALIVCPTHLPRQWQREIERFYPWLNTHIIKSGKVYEIGSPLFGAPDVLIINYAKLARGWGHHLAGHVASVVFDEGHELRNVGAGGLNNPTDKYAQCAVVAHSAKYRVAATATPVFNYAGDLWNVANVVAQDALGTREEFIREWECKHVGASGHLSVKDPAALRTHMLDQGLMLHRTRADVGRELPPVSIIEWPIETDHKLLDRMAGDVYAMAERVLNGSREEQFTTAGQLDSALRLATGVAKAPFVAEFVRFLLESENKIVLSGHHHQCYDLWRRLLIDFQPVFYTGQETAPQKAASLASFIDGDARLMIMANRSGAGVDGLQKVCSVAVVGELDWSPATHKQFVGRFHRDDLIAPVMAYFLVSTGGTDPLMAERLELKRQQADPIQNPGGPAFVSVDQEQQHIRELARRLLAGRKEAQ